MKRVEHEIQPGQTPGEHTEMKTVLAVTLGIYRPSFLFIKLEMGRGWCSSIVIWGIRIIWGGALGWLSR